MKKLLAILCLILPLTGCIPAALVVGATAGGAIVYDKRSVSQIMLDRDISQTAQNVLNSDPMLKNRAHIGVATFNRVVLMVGEAETDALKQRAYQDVARVKKIRRIYNQVRIGKPAGFGRKTDDTWITTKVKTAMLTKRGLHSTQIKVVTEDGIVYLMGLVSHQQGALATATARRVAGVKKVVKVFEYS